VDVGTRVKKGQLIADIDPTDTKTQFDQAQADYDAAIAHVQQAKFNLTLQKKANIAAIEQAKQQLATARARELQAGLQCKVQPSLTQASIRQASANLKSARDDLHQLQVATIPQAKAQAQANYDQAMADLEQARKDLERQKALLAKGFVPVSTVDTAEQRFANTQAAIHTAKAKLDTVDGQYQAQVEAAKARVDQARAMLNTAEENKMEDEIRQRDCQAARAAVKQAQAELALALANQQQQAVKDRDITAAMAQVAKSKAGLTSAHTQLGYVTILAPRNGIVLQKYIEQGTIIASGRSSVVAGTNIVQLGDISRMFITCNVDETDIATIEVGQSVDVKVDAYPNELFEGKVVRVDPQAKVDQNVTTIPVKVEISDPDVRLKPGMNADCEFITAKRENVIVVPNQALRDNDGSYEVTVLQGGRMVARAVEPGIAGPEVTEIRSGLKEGETIVTEIIQPEDATAAPQQPSSPFNPLQNRGGGGGGRGGGRGR
jgi:HlyD family secretion protein